MGTIGGMGGVMVKFYHKRGEHRDLKTLTVSETVRVFRKFRNRFYQLMVVEAFGLH